MARKSDATASLHNLTKDIAAIQDSARGCSTPKPSKEGAADLLESAQHILGMTGQDQTKFLDSIDQEYLTLNSQNAKVISAFGGVCSAIKRLPTSAIASGIEICDDFPYTSGTSADTWRGNLGSTRVSINALRFHSTQSMDKAKEILWKRVPTWMRLSHENVLPFHGVEMDRFRLALVYDCTESGGVSQHIASHPRVSRTSLLSDVAMGLKYLHQLDIPHGDLKAANVAIDQNGRARLTGYGLASINSDPSFTVLATQESLESSRWLAPEIMKPSRRENVLAMRESKPADVFAFGMLAVEIFTGQVPFVEQENAAVVVFRILRGDRPKIPKNAQEVGLTVEIWNLIERCWQQNPKKRPTIAQVVVRLQELINKTDDNNDALKETQLVAEPAAGSVREKITGKIRFRKIWMAIQPRRRSEVVDPGAVVEVFQGRARFNDVCIEPGIFRSDTQPTATPQPANVTLFTLREWFCGLISSCDPDVICLCLALNLSRNARPRGFQLVDS